MTRQLFNMETLIAQNQQWLDSEQRRQCEAQERLGADFSLLCQSDEVL